MATIPSSKIPSGPTPKPGGSGSPLNKLGSQTPRNMRPMDEARDHEFDQTPQAHDPFNKVFDGADKLKHAVGEAAHQAKKTAIEAGVASTGVGTVVAKPTAEVLDKLISAKNIKRGGKAVLGGVLLLLFWGMFSSPNAVFTNFKESTTDWSDKFVRDTYHRRTASILRWRYFKATSDGGTCDVKKDIRCLQRAGATEKEIGNMKREGIIKDGDYVGGNGRYFLTAVRYIDDSGSEKVITDPEQFIEKYPKTHQLVARFQKAIMDPKAFAFRSPQGIHQLFKFSVVRKNSLGSSSKLSDVIDDFRNKFKSGTPQIKAEGAVGENDSQKSDNASTAQTINQSIGEISKGSLTQKPDEYTSVLDDGANKLDQTITGCNLDSLMMQVSIMGKLAKAPKLIELEGSVSSLIDQSNSSDLKNWQQTSMIGNYTTKTGSVDVSKQKQFSDSGAYTLMTQGTVRDDALRGMSRYANGVMLPQVGLPTSEGCGGVSNMIGTFIVNNSALGSSSYQGGDMMRWVVEQIIMYTNSAVVPDPEKDLEAGYGVGNALGSGSAALASRIGRGAGDRPVNTQEFDKIDRDALSSSHIISQATAKNDTRTPLERLRDTVGFKTLPIIEGVANNDARLTIGGVGSLLATTPENIINLVSQKTLAKEPYKDRYRGNLCTDYDVRVELGMHPFWSCDPIESQLPEDITGLKFTPPQVLSYMIGNGYIYDREQEYTEDVFTGNLDELLQACRERGITDPVACVPKEQESFTSFSGGPKIFGNNACKDANLKSPRDINKPEENCTPGKHSYDFVDGGDRTLKYRNGPMFLKWYATCIIWNHPIISQKYQHLLIPQYLPGEHVKISETDTCTDTTSNNSGPIAEMHRFFQFYIKDHNMQDALENFGSNTLGDDTCSDPIYPNPNKFCALDSGTRASYMSTASSTSSTAAGNGSTSPATSANQPGNYADSNQACPAGTADAGIIKTKYTGSAVSSPNPSIRLCILSSIANAKVNAAVADQFQRMGEAAKAAGRSLTATSSFRLDNSCGGTYNNPRCATPGASPHQLGIAIDFTLADGAVGTSTTSCAARVTSTDPRWIWLRDNASSYGIKQFTYENWHWDTLGSSNRC